MVCDTSHWCGDANPLEWGKQTLFVNAAIQGDNEMPSHLPWLVDLELPKSNTTFGVEYQKGDDENVALKR